MNKILSP